MSSNPSGRYPDMFRTSMLCLHKMASWFVMLPPSIDEAKPSQIGPFDTRLRHLLPHNKVSGNQTSGKGSNPQLSQNGWRGTQQYISRCLNPRAALWTKVLKLSKDVANLVVDDGSRNPNAFAAYDSEPPLPPKLKSRGVIAMDITEQFINAAQRMSSDFFCGSRADNFKSWIWASSLRTPTSLYLSPLVLWK
jgi:hypothetical protein